MGAPSSAQALPKQTPNTSAPIIDQDVAIPQGATTIHVTGYVTSAWRYIFGLFALKTTVISPTWTQSVSNPPTQAEVEAIVTQVKLLSQSLGRSS